MNKEIICPKCQSKKINNAWPIPLLAGGCLSILLIGIITLPIAIIIGIAFKIKNVKYCSDCRNFFVYKDK